jgi:hypothetical protein
MSSSSGDYWPSRYKPLLPTDNTLDDVAVDDRRLNDKDQLIRDVLSELRRLDKKAVKRALRSLPPAVLYQLLTALKR